MIGAGHDKLHAPTPSTQARHRLDQILALEAKPDAVASACPFCLIMLEEAAGSRGVRERLRPLDVVELVAEHLEE